jgi:PAS domain S-box-containing protein
VQRPYDHGGLVTGSALSTSKLSLPLVRSSTIRPVRGFRGLVPMLMLGQNAVASLYWAADGSVSGRWIPVRGVPELLTLGLSIAALVWLWRHWVHLRAGEAESARVQRTVSALEETTEDLLWEADLDGTLTYVSCLVHTFLGYRPGDLIGGQLNAILAQRERLRAADLIHTSALTGRDWQDECYVFLDDGGHEVPLLCTGGAYINAKGEIIGFTGTLRQPENAAASRRDHEATRLRVTQILQRNSLQIVFQPIVDIQTRKVVGAEALARFPADASRPPDRFFADAVSVGLGLEFELLAVEKALGTAGRLPGRIYVSVNLSPATLVSGKLAQLLTASHWDPRRLVIEITEHVSVENYAPVNSAVSALRERGIRLAVDDAGAGYASFQHILMLRPDFIKLDRALIAGIDSDPAKRALVAAMSTFAREIRADIIAEGVESPAELDAACALGLRYAQGYLTGRPSPAHPNWGSATARGFPRTPMPLART